ncbi:phosphoribosylamine--glycine ligase [Streptohalobacillus salinus]|uniref:Phosphoribosylamine--glycine ligase n=1 Tax=Streptohalobacillus salinus TaxID=621096 RepID=A0A2V3WD56_9BACI|nr:phosphoribosylamine--glycine ligase [Streptohalobacillus salinus]PXW91041.1 phosphoribosylamine--glycine ligase [Streptohalobacillus salinus]
MKVLVVGSGGREHMLVKKLNQSAKVSQVFAAPGNAGIEHEATCVAIKDDAISDLLAFAKSEAIDWTIVGPEVPLAKGIVNQFKAAGLAIFGPTKEAAIIEGSKDFTKALMKKYQIPSADYQTFTDVDKAHAYIKERGAPIVVKADGLAAGKGVVVAMCEQEAHTAVDEMLIDHQFGAAGARVVIEEYLAGEEFSLFAFVEGENVYPMIPARDHKRAFDGDQGPNTGGMGAYAPLDDLSEAKINFTVESVLKPVAKAMVEEGRPYSGVLYAGLIDTEDGVKVIEFNARLGDPETQVVLPLLENDLMEVIIKLAAGEDPNLRWKQGYAIGTVVAAQGYPGNYQTGIALPELTNDADSYVIHAGTKRDGNAIVSNGGRVLLVGSVKATPEQAQQAVNDYLKIFNQSDAFFYRTDIGFKH